jgi:hypothetical protein
LIWLPKPMGKLRAEIGDATNVKKLVGFSTAESAAAVHPACERAAGRFAEAGTGAARAAR